MRKRQSGSALVYILIAIALLAALTATFMDNSGQQTSSQSSFDVTSTLKAQADMIRSAVQECVLSYPNGDVNIAGTGAVSGHTPVRPYPLRPDNAYLAGPTAFPPQVKDIRCPGNPGSSNNHAPIFSAQSGNFFPPAPPGFTTWYYTNNIDGVFIWTASDRKDAYIATALKKLDALYSKCESQYVDGTSSPVYFESTGVAGLSCGGSQCFRLWIRPTGTAVYPGETGCP